MLVRELQDKIRTLKTEKDFCILAHSYMSHEILEVADFTGDSYQLSVKAAGVKEQNIVMCGVRFMAETAKILSPQKHVYLPNPDAGCPMAEQFNVEQIEQLKKQYPGYAVVAYINTTAALKTVCDVCVTSASAVQVIAKMKQKDILFIPDCNLGHYVKQQLPDKNIRLVQGGCPIHAAVTGQDAVQAKKEHPGALLLVHPECRPEVEEQADYIGSTSGIMNYVAQSKNTDFIIGTENSICQHLQYAYPKKNFYPLSKHLICCDMKLITLSDLYNCINGTAGEEIILSDSVLQQSRKCIDQMIELGQ